MNASGVIGYDDDESEALTAGDGGWDGDGSGWGSEPDGPDPYENPPTPAPAQFDWGEDNVSDADFLRVMAAQENGGRFGPAPRPTEELRGQLERILPRRGAEPWRS